MKYYRMTWEQAMWGISMQNLMLLMKAIPDFGEDEELGDDEFDELFSNNKA